MDKITLLDGSVVNPSEIDLTDDKVYYGDLGKLALSSSSCKLLLESPKKYKYITMYGESSSTSALDLGRLIHLYFLEPHRIDEECIFIECKTRGAKVFKEAVAELGSSQMIYTTEEKAKAERVADALMQNDKAVSYLNKSTTEEGILSEVYGLPFRAKADIIQGNSLIDLKTTGTDIDAFRFSANKYNYDLQAYLYLKMFNLDNFTFLVVNKSNLDIGVFHTSKEFLERGREKLERAVEVYNSWFRGADLRDCDVSNYYLEGIL